MRRARRQRRSERFVMVPEGAFNSRDPARVANTAQDVTALPSFEDVQTRIINGGARHTNDFVPSFIVFFRLLPAFEFVLQWIVDPGDRLANDRLPQLWALPSFSNQGIERNKAGGPVRCRGAGINPRR